MAGVCLNQLPVAKRAAQWAESPGKYLLENTIVTMHFNITPLNIFPPKAISHPFSTLSCLGVCIHALCVISFYCQIVYLSWILNTVTSERLLIIQYCIDGHTWLIPVNCVAVYVPCINFIEGGDGFVPFWVYCTVLHSKGPWLKSWQNHLDIFWGLKICLFSIAFHSDTVGV